MSLNSQSLNSHVQGNGFVDPKTGKVRTIPFEVKVQGDKEPIYEETLEDLRR